MQPVLLALESSSEQCSVALLANGEVFEASWSGAKSHSERLLPEIEKLLGQANITMNDLSALLYGAGPGAFTSLRTTCGAAQGLSLSLGLTAHGYSSLQCLASQHLAQEAKQVLAVLDARMGQLYCAVYKQNEILLAPCLVDNAAFPALAAQYPQAMMIGQLPAELALEPELKFETAVRLPSAVDLIRLYQSGATPLQLGSAASITPLYVRDKVAFTELERKAMK